MLGERTAELDGLAPIAPSDSGRVSARAAILVRDLVDPARTTALEKLDVGRRAIAIATAWVRSKAEMSDPRADGDHPIAPTL